MTNTETILSNATNYSNPASIRHILHNYSRLYALAQTGNMAAADIMIDIDMALKTIRYYRMMKSKNYRYAILITVWQHTAEEVCQTEHCTSRQTPCNAANKLCTLISDILTDKIDYAPYEQRLEKSKKYWRNR